jgi:hypothetical protein
MKINSIIVYMIISYETNIPILLFLDIIYHYGWLLILLLNYQI